MRAHGEWGPDSHRERVGSSWRAQGAACPAVTREGAASRRSAIDVMCLRAGVITHRAPLKSPAGPLKRNSEGTSLRLHTATLDNNGTEARESCQKGEERRWKDSHGAEWKDNQEISFDI